jgi:cytochrome c
MRFGLSLWLCAASLLVACSKPASTTQSPAAPEATTPAPAPTDAAQKAILATLPAAYRNADLDNGQAKFALCKACHTFGQGEEAAVGPNLWGVFGRKAGSVPGFAYSDSMKKLGVTWDADKINTWIAKPSAMVPGTRMTYAGMESAKDRADVVAYLKVVTTAPAK